MLILGSVMAVMGFTLLWFSPFSGILIMVIGLGIVWSYEDQKARTKNEQKRYEEEKELEFNRIKYSDTKCKCKRGDLSLACYGILACCGQRLFWRLGAGGSGVRLEYI